MKQAHVKTNSLHQFDLDGLTARGINKGQDNVKQRSIYMYQACLRQTGFLGGKDHKELPTRPSNDILGHRK